MRFIGVNIEGANHWCVLINNNLFSLTTDNGSYDGKIIILR